MPFLVNAPKIKGQIADPHVPTATMNPLPIALVRAGYNSTKYIYRMI